MASTYLKLPLTGGGGGGAVDSFNGRTGIVVPVSGDYNAIKITNTPAGTIAATNVQAALNELDGDISGKLTAANNLSDLASAATARTNLGLGTLATQSGTFSGTSSGTNTGDQTITLTGVVTGSGTGSFATSLGSFSSSDLRTALTDETGTGVAVFATSPTLVTPVLGTPASGSLVNCSLLTTHADNSIPRMDGTDTGKLQSSGITIGDVSGGANDIDGTIRTITISGQTSDYTSVPNPFIYKSGNHVWDYASLTVPPVLQFIGTHTIKQDAFIFGMGFLFDSAATFVNNAATARAMASFYTFSSRNVFRADGAAVTLPAQLELLLNSSVERVNSGTFSITSWTNAQFGLTIGAGCTVTTRQGLIVQTPSNSGTLTNNHGIIVAAQNTGTNNTNLLLGGTSNATGNFNIRQVDETVNQWNASQRWKLTNSASTSITLTGVNHYVLLSSTSTVTCTLPDATTTTGAEFLIMKTGASGTINVTSVSGQTFNGAASPIAITTQYNMVRVISNGTNWTVLRNGAP